MKSPFRQLPEFNEGRAEAEAGIAAGSLAYRLSGKLDWLVCEEAAAILGARHSVKLVLDGHCIIPAEKMALDEGFNRRMREEFDRRFGQDVVAAVFREVERKRKKRR